MTWLETFKMLYVDNPVWWALLFVLHIFVRNSRNDYTNCAHYNLLHWDLSSNLQSSVAELGENKACCKCALLLAWMPLSFPKTFKGWSWLFNIKICLPRRGRWRIRNQMYSLLHHCLPIRYKWQKNFLLIYLLPLLLFFHAQIITLTDTISDWSEDIT